MCDGLLIKEEGFTRAPLHRLELFGNVYLNDLFLQFTHIVFPLVYNPYFVRRGNTRYIILGPQAKEGEGIHGIILGE